VGELARLPIPLLEQDLDQQGSERAPFGNQDDKIGKPLDIGDNRTMRAFVLRPIAHHPSESSDRLPAP
jgi:hypothetical protein